MKIYTKTGDQGTTSLFSGKRVPKHHIRIESYGTVDELNSWLGLIADQEMAMVYKNQLRRIQNSLFTVGAILATVPQEKKPGNEKKGKTVEGITEEDIHFLEEAMDQMDDFLPQMTHFIVPGGHSTVSYCHIARTVCRRAERKTTFLYENESFDASVLVYLNRLSDYLFVLARKLSMDLGVEEIKWLPNKKD